MMKTNKPVKVISHIDLSTPIQLTTVKEAKNKILGINDTEMFPTKIKTVPIRSKDGTIYTVRDFSELTKQENRRHSRQVNRVNAKVALFNKEYFRYIYLMLKSIF